MSFEIVSAPERLRPPRTRQRTSEVRKYIEQLDYEINAQKNTLQQVRREQLPPDIDEKILARLDCVGRSLYCAAKGTPLEKRSLRDRADTQICEENAFRRLHDAKCAVEKNRTRESQQNLVDGDLTSDLTLRILDNVESETSEDVNVERRRRTDLNVLLNDWEFKKLPENELSQIFRRAAFIGHAEVVKHLLNWRGPNGERVDPTAADDYAVRFASGNGHAEVVKLLLADTRVDPRADNDHAMRMASMHGHAEVVKLLLNWRGPNGERVDPRAPDDWAWSSY